MTGEDAFAVSNQGRPHKTKISLLIRAVRIGSSAISLVGMILLIRLLLSAVNGDLVQQLPVELQQAGWSTAAALGLGLPVPLHVIAIGLVLQKRWLSPRLAKAAWVAIVVSGCWLGLALAGKLLLDM